MQAKRLTTTSLRAACISREPLDESEKGSGEDEGEDPKRRNKVPKVSDFARLSGGAAAIPNVLQLSSVGRKTKDGGMLGCSC